MRSTSHFTTRVRPVDWAVFALLAFELPSLRFSQDRANSIGAAEVVALSILVYFAVRVLLRVPIGAAWFAALVGFAGAWLAITGIHQFAESAQQLAVAGLTDLVAFRSRLIHPISNWVPGESFTALLLALPFACAAAAYAWFRGSPVSESRPFGKLRAGSGAPRVLVALLALVPAAAIVAALFLSLSRAAFWSTVFFFVVACALMAAYRVVTLRTASLLLAGSLGALLVIMACELPLYPGIFRAYAGSHVSQSRSTEGRIDIWTRSLELTRGHRVWGVGSSNAALFLLSSAGEDETTGFASRAFSLPVQVLAENGLAGFACYAAFLLLLGWEFHRGTRSTMPPTAGVNGTSSGVKQKKKNQGASSERARLQAENAHRAMKCCFAAGLAAVLFRELTYSSLLEHTLTLALAFALAALMCAPSQPDSLRIKPVAIAVAAVVLICQWPYWRFAQADGKLSDFYGQVASANFIAAKDSIEDAIRLWPWNARYYGWRAYVASQELPSQCPRHSKNDLTGLDAPNQRAAREAADDYRHALTLNDRDAVAHHNLAWLEHLLGDDAAAARDWKEAVEIDPDNAAFHLSYGMFLEETGSLDAARSQYVSAIAKKPSILDSPFFKRLRTRSPEAADSVVKNAMTQLEAKLGQGNDPILEARLGKLYLVAGDSGQAEKTLLDAAQQLPNLPLVWFNLGELYEARGDDEQARIYYERARAIDGSLAGPYLQLGELSLQAGDKNDAIHNLDLAVVRWQRINPITSAHNNRLYDGPRQTIDDLLPTTLVWYISPCEASEAWSALAQLNPQNGGYAQRNRTCEELPSPHGELQ